MQLQIYWVLQDFRYRWILKILPLVHVFLVFWERPDRIDISQFADPYTAPLLIEYFISVVYLADFAANVISLGGVCMKKRARQFQAALTLILITDLALEWSLCVHGNYLGVPFYIRWSRPIRPFFLYFHYDCLANEARKIRLCIPRLIDILMLVFFSVAVLALFLVTAYRGIDTNAFPNFFKVSNELGGSCFPLTDAAAVFTRDLLVLRCSFSGGAAAVHFLSGRRSRSDDGRNL